MTKDARLLGIYTGITCAKDSIALHHKDDADSKTVCEYMGHCQFVTVYTATRGNFDYMIMELPINESARDVW